MDKAAMESDDGKQGGETSSPLMVPDNTASGGTERSTSTSPSSPGTSSQSSSTGNTSTKKSDKPKLRKGKWTIEEEEYTSRIIQYFSTGLLTLPDGATLRSFLAEKLNCDPMRITKKFTGACCLGRRAYHLRDRPRASPTEVEMARLDLQNLENRFRLRVEHEMTGLPLPPRQEMIAAQPSSSSSVAAAAGGHSSLYAMSQGPPSIAPGMVPSNPWLQPSTPANNTSSTNPAVAAAAASGVPSVLNPSTILSQLPRNNGGAPSLALPGINSLSLPGSGTSAAAQLTASSFHPSIAAEPHSQLPPGVLQQLLLQAAASQSNASQHGGVDRGDGSSVQLLNSVLASVALAQAANALNQGPSVGATAPPPVASPPVASLSQPFNSRVAPPAAAAAATASSNASAPSSMHLSRAVAPTLMTSPQAQKAQASLMQQMAQTASLQQPSEMTKPPAVPAAAAPPPAATQTPAILATSAANSKPPKSALPVQSNRVSQLKAAYVEQQEALRLAYEKTLKEHEEQERKEQAALAGSSGSVTAVEAKSGGTGGEGNGGSAQSDEKMLSPAEQLQKSYEAHLASLQKTDKKMTTQTGPSNGTTLPSDRKIKKKKKKVVTKRAGGQPQGGKSKEEEAGVLLGFLNSLRTSYEDEVANEGDQSQDIDPDATSPPSKGKSKKQKSGVAVEKPVDSNTNKKQVKKDDQRIVSSKKPTVQQQDGQNGKRRRDGSPTTTGEQQMKDASITAMMQSNKNKLKPVSESSSNNSSSQPSTEQSSSSIEDSDSKSDKTDNTSGDESDDEISSSKQRVTSNVGSSATAATTTTTSSSSKGPPRKRLKPMQETNNEFTTANLLEHSQRMELESTSSRQASPSSASTS